MILNYKICGIPCQLEVTQFSVDSDHWGAYAEICYNVLDRRGYPAKWLEKKITSAMESKIEEDIAEAFYSNDDY